MSSSQFASSFAPYTPPPDDPHITPPPQISTAWFPPSHNNNTSYQSGGIPTFGSSASGGLGAVEDSEGQNQWETSYGLRVDLLAAVAYLLGPISALVLLIVETQNDYVRFHAYQSALLTTPLVGLRIFASLLQFPLWIRTLFTLLLVCSALYMAFKAYGDASRNGLVHYQLPIVGPIADKWLQEE